MNFLYEILNWSKNPKNVFILAMPLALFGTLLMFARAYVEYTKNGDIVYFAIFVTGMLILAMALIPAFKMHKFNTKTAKK